MTAREHFQPKIFALALAMAALWATAAEAQPQYRQGAPPFLQQLHDDLQLSPSQDDAWKTFQQSSQPDPQEMAQAREAYSKMPSLTGPQRMDQAISMAEQNLARLHRRADALKSFYAALTPQQQKIFDRDTLGPGN